MFIRFVRGKRPGQGSGFDINDDDLLEMEQCRELVVASAIFSKSISCLSYGCIKFICSLVDTIVQGTMI
jgi:hypothetical protein